MTNDSQELLHHYILISSYESNPQNLLQYGTREDYNKFFMTYNLIHEIGHALSMEYYGSLPKIVKAHLDEEMLANQLAAWFWKEFNGELYQEIQFIHQGLMEEVYHACKVPNNSNDAVMDFFLHNCRIRYDNRLIYINQESHEKYQDYFHTYSIVESGKGTTNFHDLCLLHFPVSIDIHNTMLPTLDYSSDTYLVETVCNFCQQIGYWVPLSVFILDDEETFYNCYCNNFDSRNHLVRFKFLSISK
jgi:hypothetical protein